MEQVTAIYTGELGSGVHIPELGITVKPGEPFECTKDWLDGKIKIEPERWKRHHKEAARAAKE